MTPDRAAIMRMALDEVGVEVGQHTRYANDTGTCLRCTTGTMVMVPDDASQPYFTQASGAEALQARLDPVFDRLWREAAETQVHRSARDALAAAGDALFHEGFDAGYQAALGEARKVFGRMIVAKFGAVPPSVSMRIQLASFDDMARWAARLSSVRHVTAVII